jgi:catechol 2,3-dioxygenase-like lactoylglutathione lyase family enzyme
MKRLIIGLGFALALAAPALADDMRVPFNDAGVTMGHWHLNSTNVEDAKKLFVALGGKSMKPGDFEIVVFPGVIVNLHLRGTVPPPSGPTVGTVVNHVGFIVNNVQEQVAKWKAAGVAVLPGNNGRVDQAYVVTPDGVRIEVLEDKSQAVPIKHEHVHFYLPEAEIAKSQAWYAKTFGATAGSRNNSPVADIPGVQLRFAKADTAQVPTKGRALDHMASM